MRRALPTTLLIPALLLGGCTCTGGPRGDAHGAVTGVHPAVHPSLHGAPTQADVDGPVESRALAPSALLDLDGVAARLTERQTVFVGESHNRYEHHLNQLEIIRRLHAAHPDLAIGMEYFQQPFQRYLDEYIAGTLDEKGDAQGDAVLRALAVRLPALPAHPQLRP